MSLIPFADSDSPTGRRIPFDSGSQQGRALEMLGHSLDYLIDSRMHLIDKPYTKADNDAVRILARLSRSVFAEC